MNKKLLIVLSSLLFLVSAAAIAQTYGKVSSHQEKADKQGQKLTEEQKALVRADIIKKAKAIMAKNPEYSERISVYHDRLEQKVKYRIDCSGFVNAVYSSVNISVFEKQSKVLRGANGVKIIYDTLKQFDKIYKVKKPNPGDIIFFDNTWDKNRNGKNDDELVHTGLVLDVDPDGTISFIHSFSKGVVISKANLYRPDQKFDKNGKRLNSALRRKRSTDAPGTKYYAGGLINSFGTVLDVPKGESF